MRVLVDNRIWGATGIQEYSNNLLKALLELDKINDYTLFANSFRSHPANFQFPNLNFQINSNSQNLKIINWKIPNKFLDISARFFDWPQLDRSIECDLIFSPHFNILAKHKTPRVITFHDLSFIHHPDFFSWRQKFWHWLQNAKKQAKEAEKIIAVSEFTKSDLVNLFGVAPEKISVIYSGISKEFRKVSSVPPKARLAKGGKCQVSGVPNKPYILYLGTLEPRKNVSAIIRAFNILKRKPEFSDWQLVIAGKPGWLYQNILREAERSPYRQDIVFKGGVSSEERVSLYNLAKVFVYPSFFEGFGFPPLEAQACGCPVVASNRTSLPEVLNKSALFADPWRVDELAEAIDQAALNSRVRAKLIRAGYANAKKFNWQDAAQKTLKIINDI